MICLLHIHAATNHLIVWNRMKRVREILHTHCLHQRVVPHLTFEHACRRAIFTPEIQWSFCIHTTKRLSDVSKSSCDQTCCKSQQAATTALDLAMRAEAVTRSKNNLGLMHWAIMKKSLCAERATVRKMLENLHKRQQIERELREAIGAEKDGIKWSGE